MVDVLTVTKRTGWEKLAQESLDKQTYRHVNWIVVTEQPLEIKGATVIRAPKKKRHSNLNASLNAGLRACTSKYVVFYQDFIRLDDNCIEKLVTLADETGGFVTTAAVNPDGRMDGRYTGVEQFRECIPEEWEANVAIAPLKALRELGGFDEEYDDGWSWDNVNVAERAAMLGYKFYIDETNQPKLYYHIKEPEADPTLILNATLHNIKMSRIRAGKDPIKLPYL